MNRFTEQTPTISSVEEIKEEPAHWHTMAMTTSEIAENDGESADGAFKVDILCALFGSERRSANGMRAMSAGRLESRSRWQTVPVWHASARDLSASSIFACSAPRCSKLSTRDHYALQHICMLADSVRSADNVDFLG